MTTTILIIVNVFAALAIIVLALMQQSKGDMGSAFGGGGSQSMFGSRGSANFLSRMTATMCALFFISSLSLAYVYAKRTDATSVIQQDSVLERNSESEVPTVGEEIPSAGEEVPTIDGEVPVVGEELSEVSEQESETTEDAPQTAGEQANEATKAADQEVPEVPE